MDNAPPVYDTQRIKDDEHLKLLSIFHFVIGGLALFGIAFLVLHYLLISAFFLHPEKGHPKNGELPPEEFFRIFIWFYFFMGVVLVTAAILNVLSGTFLRQRKHRMFSLIVAALNCVQIPVGTTLGVFTIIVLLRDSIRQSYIS